MNFNDTLTCFRVILETLETSQSPFVVINIVTAQLVQFFKISPFVFNEKKMSKRF